MDPIEVKAYTKGKGVCGIYIRKSDRKFFDPQWSSVKIEIDGDVFDVDITDGFWRECPQLRSPVIGDWLRRQGAEDWPHRKPPAFDLIPLGRRRFRLVEQ